jgi:acetolactate synthase regulatory subunit
MAPHIFYEVDGQSAVYHQPETEEEYQQGLQALLACPTGSIGTVEKPREIKSVQESFPLRITEFIYHCGFHSEKSYGATSYLIQRPEGNILVDSPRFIAPLVKQLEALGGVQILYLTHRDDVADHQKYHDHFGCERVLHEFDITSETRAVEHPLSGLDPVVLAPDLQVIPVPGHTRGHTVLLYQNRFLFTGDHLAWSEELHHLYAFRQACWYSWSTQINSMMRLKEYPFEWILPGHGRRFYSDLNTMESHMDQCIQWMQGLI